MNEEKIITLEEAIETHKDLFPETEERERELEAKPSEQDVPEALKDFFKEHLRNQFTYGLKIGLNTGVGIIYEKIGVGDTDFTAMEKEDLVLLLDAIALWCDTALDSDYKEELRARMAQDKKVHTEDTGQKGERDE